MEAIASLFSGLGIWFGKWPSGSRNWLPVVSAPSGAKTFFRKETAAAVAGVDDDVHPFQGTIVHARAEAGADFLAQVQGVAFDESNEAMAAVDTAVAESFEARVRTSLTSFFSRPPFSVKNLRPLRLYGRWLAVIMMAPSMAVSSKMMDMNMAGVEARRSR